MKIDEKFLHALLKLKDDPIMVVGLAKLLNVPLLNGEDVRDSIEILSNILINFKALGRAQKRRILKLTKDAANP